MKLKAVCCEVLYREFCAAAARSVNQVDLAFLPKGLHDLGAPAMRARLQETIDGVDASCYDALALGYGLCSNGIAGLHSPLPMVVPRAHDCITLFLGDRARYQHYFDSHPGAYFLTSGWIERGSGDGQPSTMESPQRLGLNLTLKQMIEKYGEENGQFLYQTLHAHEDRYATLAFIEMGLEPGGQFEDHARQRAARHGWAFEKLHGDMTLIERLLNGPWDDPDFLVIPPGKTVAPASDNSIIRCETTQ